MDETRKLIDAAGYFDVSISLILLLGFVEDYKRVIVNTKHELILTRSTTDANALIKTGKTVGAALVKISNIEWLMPYVKLSDKHKIK